MILAFDFETNGLLDRRDLKAHALSVIDIDTGAEKIYIPSAYRVQGMKIDGTIEDGVAYLKTANTIVAHHGLGFDLPVLQRLYGYDPGVLNQTVLDTAILAPLAYPDIRNSDFRRKNFPSTLIGKHSIEAWGHRLGILKGDYGIGRTDWSIFSIDMLDYCLQDSRICAAIYKRIESLNIPTAVIRLEHEFASIMRKQEAVGVAFDVRKAMVLLDTLRAESNIIQEDLGKIFPPELVEYETPVRREKKTRSVPFNPNSRQQIAARLKKKYDWKPTELTETGQVIVDEEVLSGLDYPEAKVLCRHMMLAKRIGQLADGENGLIKMQKEGRIHGRVATLGTVSGRCAHFSPNLGQIPGVDIEFGKEFRELFIPSDGLVMVGCDLSGIQLRCLAHYLYKYDNGAYADIVVKGDPHERNRVLAGLETRKQAKSFIYALLFGAGNAKLAGMLGVSEVAAKVARDRFMNGFPAFSSLVDGITGVISRRPYLIGLDGRAYQIRSSHSALNLLLQGAEAVIMKVATVKFHQLMSDYGHKIGTDYNQVLHVHDEIGIECRSDIADQVGDTFKKSVRYAKDKLNVNCDLDAEYRIGMSWKETH